MEIYCLMYILLLHLYVQCMNTDAEKEIMTIICQDFFNDYLVLFVRFCSLTNQILTILFNILNTPKLLGNLRNLAEILGAVHFCPLKLYTIIR